MSTVPAQSDSKPPMIKSSTSSRQRRSQKTSGSHTEEQESEYSEELATLRELFPDWKNEDLIPLLSESDGNLEIVIEQIAQGMSFYLHIFK